MNGSIFKHTKNQYRQLKMTNQYHTKYEQPMLFILSIFINTVAKNRDLWLLFLSLEEFPSAKEKEKKNLVYNSYT